MFEHFIPNFIFDKFDDVTPEFLKAEGISFLLIDIDNTLAPYEEPLPNERVKAWFAALDAAGIRAILVSNNHADRVELFNSQLGLPAFADCHKPSPRRMRRLMESFGATLEETAAYGHFGRKPYTKEVDVRVNGQWVKKEVQFFGWEQLDAVEKVKEVFGL